MDVEYFDKKRIRYKIREMSLRFPQGNSKWCELNLNETGQFDVKNLNGRFNSVTFKNHKQIKSDLPNKIIMPDSKSSKTFFLI